MKLLESVFVALVFSLLAATSSATIMLEFDPVEAEVTAGESVSVDLIADIDSAESIIGWGLTLRYDSAVLSLTDVWLGGVWSPALIAGDEINAFAAFPVPTVSGDDVLLATLTFDAIGSGITQLSSLNEQFALPVPGLFADVSTTPADINVVPEPATAFLLGGVFLLARRRLSDWKLPA